MKVRSVVLPICVALLALSTIPRTSSAGAASPLLAYHGGEVMPTSTTFAIFWLPAGRHFESNGDDAHFESGIAQFFRDIGGTPYYGVATQYSKDLQGNPVKNGPILNQSTFGGSWVDTTPYPHAGTSSDPMQVSDYRDAVTRALAANHWTPGIEKIYFVYTAESVEVCGLTSLFATPGFGGDDCTFDPLTTCMAHGSFIQDAQPVLYAVMPEPAETGCIPDPGPPQDPNEDIRMDAGMTLSALTLMGAVTDPLGTGWYNGAALAGELGCGMGNETILDLRYNGHMYALFGLYSNAQSDCAHAYPPPALDAVLHAKVAAPHSRQTLRVSTVAGAHVHIDIVYANGNDKQQTGVADASGVYRLAWHVPAIAGRVDLNIDVSTADGGSAGITRHFRIR